MQTAGPQALARRTRGKKKTNWWIERERTRSYLFGVQVWIGLGAARCSFVLESFEPRTPAAAHFITEGPRRPLLSFPQQRQLSSVNPQPDGIKQPQTLIDRIQDQGGIKKAAKAFEVSVLDRWETRPKWIGVACKM